MYRILLVEDDVWICDKTSDFLQSWNYKVRTIRDFERVLDEFYDFQPDLVIMDITLPVYNGFYWTNEIRKFSKVPILFLSSACDNMNIVLALSQGADDFIAKPFELQVLQAKIKALLRRTYDFGGKTECLEYRGLRFMVEQNLIQFADKEEELSKNEGKILRILLENKGKIVSRHDLMNYLWKTDCYVDENTLSVNVNRLRKKLDLLGCSNYIKTKKGIGYSL